MTSRSVSPAHPDLLALGREARRLREARDLTQEKLADGAGLHPNYIGRIERGESNVGVKALFKLPRGLEVEPSALFEREGSHLRTPI